LLNPPLSNRSGLSSQVAALFAGPFKRRLEWTKLRCQAVVRLTAANKALALSESSRSVHNPPLTPVLHPPYNTLFASLTPWHSDGFRVPVR